MTVTIQTAETQLPQLVEAAESGEEVILAEGEMPVAKIVALPKRRRFKIGLLKELKGTTPDFLEPMDEEELRLWEGRG